MPSDRHADHDVFLDVDGSLGYMLWQRLRDVKLWASLQPEPPYQLFGAGPADARHLTREALANAPEIAPHLRLLNRMVRRPRRATARRVADACLGISEWAAERNRLSLALAFAEAAAFAAPRYAPAAAVAGSLCTRVPARSEGEPMEGRAARWLRRAVRVARRTKDWEWYIRAHIRYGLLMYYLGRYQEARALYERASWAADWKGREDLAGKAHHDLVAIESYVGTYEAAEAHTRLALSLYPVRGDRVPYLVHDYAFALMRFAFYAPSLQLLTVVWDHIPPENRLHINGTIARVSAALGYRDRYEAAASHVAILTEICDDGATWAYIHIAEGARYLGEWDRAEGYAARALQLAYARSELDAVRSAYEVMDAVIERARPIRAKPEPPSVTDMVTLCLNRLAKLREPEEAAVPTSRVVTTAWVP